MTCPTKNKFGCIKTDCIVKECPRKRPITTSDGYCIHYDNGTKKNAIKQVKE